MQRKQFSFGVVLLFSCLVLVVLVQPLVFPQSLSISSDTELAFCYSPFCSHSLDQDAKQIIKLSMGFPVSLHY